VTIGRFQFLWWKRWRTAFDVRRGLGGWPTEDRARVPTALYPKGIIFYFITLGPVELRWFVKARAA
jgi:hypothetical protein